MYTEAEARSKWCHRVSLDAADDGKNSRDVTRSYVECLGSRCMAWRWIGSQGPEQQGYCGLAGKP